MRAEMAPQRTKTDTRARDGQQLRRYALTRDEALLRALVARWLPLAHQLALRYSRSSEPFEDLLQVASMGLVKALKRYDPERGQAFTSYAVPTILGELKRHFRDHTWSVRVPRELQELAMKVDKSRDRLTAELGRSASVDDICADTGACQEEVLEALQAGDAHSTTSLDAARDDDDDEFSLGDLLGEADHGFHLAEDRALIGAIIDAVPDREREILRLRFEEDLTQREIAVIVGISQMQVSRLLRGSLKLLRDTADRRAAQLRHARVA